LHTQSPETGLGLDHYENEDLWRGAYWDHRQSDRARRTADLVPAAATTILDVGCGAGIVTSELRGRGKGVVALDFAATPLQQVAPPRVQADVARMPFPDHAFDAVLASEVIEHLTASGRREALADMTRIARRWVLITVPYREDLAIASVCCAECGCTFHRYRHTASFDERSLANLLGPRFVIERTILLGDRSRRPSHTAVRLAQLAGGYAAPGGSARCPMCGNAARFVHERNTLTRLLTGGSSRLMPRRRGRWIAALYGRDT
jgi:SAM-dependent methyltransferase